MKITFAKNYLSFKKDEIQDFDDVEAKDLISKNIATEVIEAEVNALDSVKELVKSTAIQAHNEGVEFARKEFHAELAKSVKGYRPQIVVGNDNAKVDKAALWKEFRTKAGSNSAVTDSNEQYALPVEFSTTIQQIINNETSLLTRVSNQTVKGRTYQMPVDKQHQIGNSPVAGAWVGEGTCVTPSNNGLLDQLKFSLNKYFTAVEITDEMLSDNVVGIESWVAKKAGNDIAWILNNAIIRGTGSTLNVANGGNAGTNQPLGILNSAALVTVTADSSDEYVSGIGFDFHDLMNMKRRFYKRPGGSPPVLLVHPDMMPFVYEMKDDAGRNLYFAPGTVQYAPVESLLGMEIVQTFACSAPGSKGDVIMADLSAYQTITKGDGIDSAKSTDIYFLCDATAYRFGVRIDGQPLYNAPITSPTGVAYSPFVTLSART